MIEVQADALRDKLKEVFGYGQFRGNQEAIIQNILTGQNTFVIMPTGAGKSLCYQLPALMLDGTAIVISPLIALMKNQVDQLNALGINAKFLNSTLTKAEMNRVRRETLDGSVKLLYVAPESLTKQDNIDFLRQAQINFVAIDEAHCISEWGHDFRPEYRRIKEIIKQLGSLPIIALTATATPKVQNDIQKNLQMEDADLFKSSFNRENLYYEVRPKKQAKKQLIQFVKQHKGKSGIIYCLSRKKVEEIAEFLKVNDVKAAPYHAGLDASIRMKNQDDFLNEEVDVIVATIAFGMGIDKPDVRFVIHYDTPKSLEGYYQETGRAGRDGLEGLCLMFYSPNDIDKLEKFNKDKSVTERDNARLLLQEMAAYSESAVCRRKQLLNYFGEQYDSAQCHSQQGCDNCKFPREQFEGKELIHTVLEAAQQTEERFDMSHLSDVIRGEENQYVVSYNHNSLPVYGKGNTDTDDHWRSVIRQTILNNFLQKDIDNVGVLKLTPKGKDFLSNPTSLMLAKDRDFSNLGEEEEPEANAAPVRSHDEALFQILKALRKKVAHSKDLPPYVIFQDPSLEEMATTYPKNQDDLVKINGVGRGKAEKFGRPFLDAIQKYVEENDIVTADDVMIKTAGAKSKLKVSIIQSIDRKIALEEIADLNKISYDELLDEMENICFAGTRLNLDYYIEDILDEERIDDAYDYFLEAESDDIDMALDELGEDDYSEDDLRLIRIKFLSEYAN
ncbi:MAG TPA: DNA helicase RecQ [Cytophagales bacterium]|nr:DNA helicase RecQ [Cytophagales bacterium]HAA18650.1 DNA helicase RecQ [Cytophagales bacterium]HAP64591.1 DNA helicase RecQ [Cytophagales bacterium]